MGQRSLTKATLNIAFQSPEEAGKNTWYKKELPFNIKGCGHSLSRLALGLLYHRKASLSAPECKAIEKLGTKLMLSFDNTAEGLQVANNRQSLRGFTICGKDRVFRQAQAKLLYGVRVMVWHDEITEPVAVAYGFSSMNQNANLENSEGIAVVPFRSDRQAGEHVLPLSWLSCDDLEDWAIQKKAITTNQCNSSQLELLPVWTISKGKADLTLEYINKQEGEASLFVTYHKTDTWLELTPSINYASLFPPLDLSAYTSISFDFFNPDRQTKQIWLNLTAVKAAEEDNTPLTVSSKKEIVVGALRWQTFSFNLHEILPSDAKDNRSIAQLSFCLQDSRGKGSFYLDNIRFLVSK